MILDLLEYKIIVESSPNMIWRAGLDAKCNYFNKTWLAFTGKLMEEEVGDAWTQGVHPDDLTECIRIYLESFAKHQPFEMEYRLKRHDGEYRWINDRGTPIYGSEGVFIGYIGSCMDVTERVEGVLLAEMARTDGVCHINNRLFSDKLLDAEFLRSIKSQETLGIIMLDVDEFKTVNDTYGHKAGDVVLRQVAAIIGALLGHKDIYGRYGGDEFIIGVVNVDVDMAMHCAERIQQVISNTDIQIGEEKNIRVTVSSGVSVMNGEKSISELVYRADQGLYLAKAAGKNCVRMVVLN